MPDNQDKNKERISLIEKTVTYSKMIKLSHTIFALPFALSGLVLAIREKPVTAEMIFWIIIAMVGEIGRAHV